MIDLQGLAQLRDALTIAIFSCDSLFLDGVSAVFNNILIWLPLIVLLVIFVLRNNDLYNSLLVFSTLVLTVTGCWGVTRLLPSVITDLRCIIPWGVAVFLMWVIRNGRIYFAGILVALSDSLLNVYIGICNVPIAVIGIIAGIICASFFYAIFKLISHKLTKQYVWNEYKTVYTRTGYLVSDIKLLFCSVILTLIIMVFISIIRPLFYF